MFLGVVGCDITCFETPKVGPLFFRFFLPVPVCVVAVMMAVLVLRVVLLYVVVIMMTILALWVVSVCVPVVFVVFIVF